MRTRTKYRSAEKVIDMHKYLIDCYGKKEWVISVDLLDEICEKYHKKQLKLLDLHNVSRCSSERVDHLEERLIKIENRFENFDKHK